MSTRGSKSKIAQKKSSTRSTKSQVSATPSVGSKTGAVPRPSTSRTNVQPKEYQLPALSVTYKPKVTESEIDKLRKRTIRRNAPPGEDLKCIKTILRTTKDQDISVQEFISLIAPSTGDNGETLRAVMNDDLAAFRKLARKVYDTITQDNSDVLLNQQLQLAEYYKEKKILLNAKMMSYVEEIYSLAPNFDFDRYTLEKEKYLNEILPLPAEVTVEPEEMEMMKRQAAYHRLQWLRSEGERLNEENNSLKKRLTQMKRMHMDEQRRLIEMEKNAEAKKEVLEATEAKKMETLEILNESLEKTIIAQEKSLRETQDSTALDPLPSKRDIKKKKSKIGKRAFRRPQWNEEAASQLESTALEGSRKREAFHFSPIKTPPLKEAPKERSPFHFSPLRTPPEEAAPRERSPFHYSPPKSPEVSTPFVTEPPPLSPQHAKQQHQIEQAFRGRRALGPQDTWGGFY